MAGMDVVLDPAWTIHWTIAFPRRYQQVRSDFSVGTRLTQAARDPERRVSISPVLIAADRQRAAAPVGQR
jgi:hypothetical protein